MLERVSVDRDLVARAAPVIAILALQQLVWPVSAGTWISGLILGMLGALLAVGMALIFRSNNVVSFAQADLGTLPATAAIVVMEVWKWGFWLALPAGLATAALLGAVIDLAFVRRFFGAPRLIVTVATIGVGQLLFFASLQFPRIWDLTPAIRTFAAPFSTKFTIGAVVFDANDLIALVVAPVVMVALAVFLRVTETGVAIRAAAAAPDRASMLGIPVKRLQTQVWALAAVLSFISVFFTAGVTGLPPGGTFSWSIMLRALAALVLGRFTNLGTIAAASVALGVLQNSMDRANDGALVGPVLVAAILIGLLVQRRGTSRAESFQRGAFVLGAEFHRLPAAIAAVPQVRFVRGVLAAAVVVLAIGAPHALGTAGALKAGVILVFAVIGLSMVVLSGWAGQASLGQMAFVGSGGAATAWCIVERSIDPVIAIGIGGLCGAFLALVVGVPALRLSGLHLAVVTLGLALAASGALFSNDVWRVIPTGTFDRPPLLGRIDVNSPERLYYLALVVLVVALIGVRGLRRSRFGRVLVAQRDNENAAGSYGINTVIIKLSAFAISGFIAAVAGGVLVIHQAAFRPENFDVSASVLVFIAAVIGGLGSPLGAVLGALYLRGAQWLLPGEWQVLASAVGVLAVLLAIPDGLGGAWFRLRDLALGRLAARSSAEPQAPSPAASQAEAA